MNDRAEIQEFISMLETMTSEANAFELDDVPAAMRGVIETFRERQLALFADMIQATQAVLETLPA